ncbi:PLP-dependent enzyme [Candidatus Magnetobacterium bavaricum]|uniref:PLP-dependent enzyme n=1 Tax=Candidatus Magnetobacterium bavaricum TaxID=29290 RepID=A0A0F3GL06_9BACT|nr:PLP-dependent enzyme [Candidatus Magnetobacterium bavaricum]
MSKLAILGGNPVRKEPFHSSVVTDDSEWKYVQHVLEAKEFSRFMGSPSGDMGKTLHMPSLEAEAIEGRYFSFLGGRMVRRFESGFANKFGVPYAVSVNSATSGLSVALGAVGAGPGDEVITTCMSFNATALSILLFNSIPVFVDVDIRNFCLDPLEIEKAITPKTKVILVVHLLGNYADMDAIMKIAKKHNLTVIEDCAQAPGTKYKGKYVGTIGDMGVFSFQETKNIMTGEGGMIITSNSDFAKKARLIRNHGESVPDETWNDDDLINIVGMNYRMTELTAALGISQLTKLDDNNRIRTENAFYLAKELNGITGIVTSQYKDGIVPHSFPLLYNSEKTGVEREKILAALRAEGIPVGSGYLRLMNENPIFLKKIAYGKSHCPWSCHLYGGTQNYNAGNYSVAKSLLRERFIWFYHINRPNDITDMKDVVNAFNKVFNNLDKLKTADISVNIGYKW